MELFLDNKIAFNEKDQIIVTDARLTGIQYVDEVLKTIHESKNLKKLDGWIEHFYIHSKFCSKVYNSIVKEIIDNGILEKENGEKLVDFSKGTFKDSKDIGEHIIQKLRAELLEERSIDENTMYLSLLLDSNKMLMAYFSEYEYKIIKERIEEVAKSNETRIFKLIKKEITKIENYSALNLVSDIIAGLV
ncbi:GPP34 family phosphoprotein [Clostridium sp. LIBA-8841]|nr:GPP34 family phosphoprotein [Clostridium sp. LIBA-8841]